MIYDEMYDERELYFQVDLCVDNDAIRSFAGSRER